MIRTTCSVLVLGLLAAPFWGQPGSFFHVADVANELSGSTFVPSEIVRFDPGTAQYSLAVALPGAPPLDALHRLQDGDWLLSVAGPTDLDGVTYTARDVIRFDGAVYSMELDAAVAGIPPESNVDILAQDGDDLILGFDVPTTLGEVTYDRSDLVRYSGGSFAMFFDASAAGVPATSDVVGASVNGADTVMTFDIATDLSGATYVRGTLVAWDGASFRSFHDDPAWPDTSGIRAFAVDSRAASGPGSVPATLQLTRSGAKGLELSWSPSCSGEASDYAIYEGELGNWYSHAMLDCSDDGGDLTETVVPSGGNRYYLVVPVDGAPNEGSYGADGSGNERPAGTTTCAIRVASTC